MLLPNKYTEFNVSIINITASIIKFLIENGACYYNEVLQQVKFKHGEDSKYEFQNALNFLFLLGKVEYYVENDALELIK